MTIHSKYRDIDKIVSLAQSCFGQEAWTKEQFEGSLALDTTKAVFLEVDGLLVGYALAQQSGEEMEILTLGVMPSHRRQGAGRKILCALIGYMPKGCVFLEVSADNEAAKKLYESIGFKIFGQRPKYYKREGCAWADALTYKLVRQDD